MRSRWMLMAAIATALAMVSEAQMKPTADAVPALANARGWEYGAIFQGGKGVATALGVFLALTPRAALVALAVFIVIVALTRLVSLASIAAAAVMPVAGLLLAPLRSPGVVAGFVFLAALVIVKHHANIRRLLAGTESRFGSPSTGKVPA